jgi:hypothetical protein
MCALLGHKKTLLCSTKIANGLAGKTCGAKIAIFPHSGAIFIVK